MGPNFLESRCENDRSAAASVRRQKRFPKRETIESVFWAVKLFVGYTSKHRHRCHF
ncbi:hypothetical protein RMSM_05512 [Rhodopirellula maiorica SM1]|uniref:Transposase n=1 Tax=Rhodopirellula maiorica SM1 TaxID=1265738 RepID=M5REP2_9BACT|nr:hypothetical protein RMSM_05512 [Rhodopirellula maiorica SM1]